MAGARGAFRAALGKCEDDHGMYYGFLPPGEPYHCEAADVELAWQQENHPNEELCDWGFGELPPRPVVVNGSWEWPYQADYQNSAPGSVPGTTPGEQVMWKEGCVAAKQAIAAGSTGGRHMMQLNCDQGCPSGFPGCCDAIYTNQTLNWGSSMVVWRITPSLRGFVDRWRSMLHRPCINVGDQLNYYAGWVRKVVRCADVPAELVGLGHAAGLSPMPGHPEVSEIEFAVRSWRELDSLMTTEDLRRQHSFADPADYTKPVNPLPAPPSVEVNVSNGTATIRLAGPDGKWFGAAFGAQRMSDLPEAIIVDGSGAVQERRLAEYAWGSQLAPLATVRSSVVVNGVRTVTLARPATPAAAGRYSFPPAGSPVEYIWAVGITADYGVHAQSAPGKEYVGPNAAFPVQLWFNASSCAGAPTGGATVLPGACAELIPSLYGSVGCGGGAAGITLCGDAACTQCLPPYPLGRPGACGVIDDPAHGLRIAVRADC